MPCITDWWCRPVSEIDWIDVSAFKERNKWYEPVLSEDELGAFEVKARGVSFAIFRMGILSLGRDEINGAINNPFAALPHDALYSISKACNPEFAPAPPFERSIAIVCQDGMMSVMYLPVDMTPGMVPAIYNTHRIPPPPPPPRAPSTQYFGDWDDDDWDVDEQDWLNDLE